MHISKRPNLSSYLKKMYGVIYKKLNCKYSSGVFSYDVITTNYLLYNDTCQAVSKFKDYLIFDDNTEFLRKFYCTDSCRPKLKKILNFYEKYSKIFPNYMILPENKYLYKNIRRKQKMIDAMNEIKREEMENRKENHLGKNGGKCEDNLIFTKKIKEEIKMFNDSQNSGLSNIEESVIKQPKLNTKNPNLITKKIKEEEKQDSSFNDILDIISKFLKEKTENKYNSLITKHRCNTEYLRTYSNNGNKNTFRSKYNNLCSQRCNRNKLSAQIKAYFSKNRNNSTSSLTKKSKNTSLSNKKPQKFLSKPKKIKKIQKIPLLKSLRPLPSSHNTICNITNTTKNNTNSQNLTLKSHKNTKKTQFLKVSLATTNPTENENNENLLEKEQPNVFSRTSGGRFYVKKKFSPPDEQAG